MNAAPDQMPQPQRHITALSLVLEYIPPRLNMPRPITGCVHTNTSTPSQNYTTQSQVTPPTTTAHTYTHLYRNKLKLEHSTAHTRTTARQRPRKAHQRFPLDDKHKQKRKHALDDTGLGLVCPRKRRRMDSALPSPSPTPPPRDTWAEYRGVVTDGNISMLSPADLSPHNPRSYAHRRECEAMDALWARPFDVRRLAAKWAGGVERASRLPDIDRRLAMRGCRTCDGEGSSFDEAEEREHHHRTDSEQSMVHGGGASSGVGDESGEEGEFDPSSTPEREPCQEGPFWFGPPLVARYSRGAPYTLQRCRARQALSDLLRSPFDNRHFRLDE